MSDDANTEPTPDERLIAAVSANSIADFRAALDAGANPDLKIDNYSIFSRLAVNGDIEMLDALISKGVNLNPRDINGLTPVMFLAWIGSTPQQYAALQRLIDAGADLAVRDSENRTALDLSKIVPARPATAILKKAHAPTGLVISHRHDGWKLE
ncbi:MAG: ankyrin repeat domain-containing protein [Planctomycetes bacterium]|nr:ankyrin repeat domain-containing protein [Planctomycetota bacterium]